MPATMLWGKGFRLEDVPMPGGRCTQELIPIDGDMEMISWSSVREVQALAAAHGVDEDLWPVFPDGEIEAEIPLDEARELSLALRAALAEIDPQVVRDDYWLNIIFGLLSKGNIFFIMV